MLNVLAPVTRQIVRGGNHGWICAHPKNNILIGAVRHPHAVAQKVCDKIKNAILAFFINMVDVIGLEPTTSSM